MYNLKEALKLIYYMLHTYEENKIFNADNLPPKWTCLKKQKVRQEPNIRMYKFSYFLCQYIIQYLMFQEISSNQELQHSHNTGSHETSLEISSGNKKSKPIRKGKSSDGRKENAEKDALIKNQLTKEQKKQIQKEKNRVAAQLSRDRQKKYLEDLEIKIVQLEKQLQTKVCSKCKASLGDNSTTQEQGEQTESMMPPVEYPENQPLSFLNEPLQIEQLPLVRDNSRNDADWGNIGRYFCILLVVLAVSLLSNSVETSHTGLTVPERQVARVLTERSICQKPIERIDVNRNVTAPSTLQQIQSESWPFKQGSSQPTEECKNNFWNNYLDDARKQLNSPHDWNLVNCNSPNLIHISSIYENDVNPLNDKWTFLITNPTVTHSHLQNTGKYYVDQVSYLSGVYQMIAEKVVLKKVMGKNCLA